MKKVIYISFILLVFSLSLSGQIPRINEDTTLSVILKSVNISEARPTISRLAPAKDVFVYQGKKNEVIRLSASDANISEKVGRQLFAKVPGIFVYDMDGTGNQLNISTRGLDPHRGWEFNIRKDGVMTNTDIYGYPASHFTIPMEAIDRIEVVRGTGALQYGAQFGGMLNYVSKTPDTSRVIGLESITTVGSYGLVSVYTSVSGRAGKFQYSAYYNRRKADGYRENNTSVFDGASVMLRYQVSESFSLKAEFSSSKYVHQLAGPLTDVMFKTDPRQSTRARNYYSPDIYLPSLTAEWKIAPRTTLKWTSSGILGSRNSVLFDRSATIPDTIIAATSAYASRQVDIDNYHSFNSELRILHQYTLGSVGSILSAGVGYINNSLHRCQQGQGTTGTDYDLTLVNTNWGRDMWFDSKNVAFYAENLIQISPKFSVSPGVRIESGHSKLSGKISYLPDEDIPNIIRHEFPLFGISSNFDIKTNQSLYAGWSMAYRPVILKDIIPASTFERADKDLKDANGYNLELGYRGSANQFTWDLSVYRLAYNDRLGTLVQTENAETYFFRTNIGNSVTHGVELFAEYSWYLSRQFQISLFTSTAYTDARYQNAIVRSGNENISVDNNKVESTPAWISRNGLTLKRYPASVTILYSYTAASFADPLNTVIPSITGAIGEVPSYGLLDIAATLRLSDIITIRLSGNNLTDKKYFTKRPSFYPGQGIWPSDGRSFNVSFGVRL